MRRPAAAAGAAAAAVEDRQRDAGLAGDGGELLLGAVDRPARREVAAVLAGVGVAHHHLDATPACGDAGRERSSASSVAHDLRRCAEVGDRLEQRHDRRAGSSPRSSTASTSSAEVVAETITVSSARAPCRRRAAATAAKTPRGALVGRVHLVCVQAHVELREVEAEQLDPALERGEPPPRHARRAGGVEAAADHARSARSSSGLRYSSSLIRAHMNESLRRYGSNAFRCRIWRRRAAARARRARSTRPARARRARATCSTRSRPRARGLTAVAGERELARALQRSRDRRAPTAGFPSRSPPIQVPKEKGGGASGKRSRYTAKSRSAPRRAGSPRRTRGRGGSRRSRAGALRAPRRSARGS